MAVHPLRPPGSPLARQLRFVARILELVPRLLAELESGHVEARQQLGRRRLPDGRFVDLWLVAKAPERDVTPLVRGRE